MLGPSQRELLHHGGTPATWGNLGLWPAHPDADAADYANACRALALRVGEAAALGPGQTVLSLACGAGDELALWVAAFSVAQATGCEIDPAARALAQQTAGPGCSVTATPPEGLFDAVLCVDAAYHFSPRAAWLAETWARLKPGGRLAFTDLVLDGRRSMLLRGAARLCGVPAGDLCGTATRAAQLLAAGFTAVQHQRLDAEVLDGFAAFAHRQRRHIGRQAWGPGWRRVAITAALIPPCRAAGLGYALWSARKP
ncbi:MAG: class I SAM-dependent methyltransferase [Rubrivivax sp.]|nr:class I SAM-dependent methyltransferase [Rubrivivax sp.]